MIAEPAMDRRPSPGLSLNLSSNNPFRNRATSPGFPSPALNTPSSTSSRPMSRNPFLQTFEAEFNKEASNSQLIDMSASMKESPKKATFGSTAEELFKNLTLDEGDGKRRPPPPRPTAQRSGSIPLSNHRPSRSDEDEKERPPRGPPRGPPRSRGPPGPRPPNNSSPERREHRRPRRNSESSMVDKGSLDPNEERRRRERRRERDERTRDGKSSRSGRVRKPHGLDIIDKLDVSGIYGPSLIHHDGPYDAVQPHRNRKKDHRAPMHAFPAGSANNIVGGSGPLNSKIDLDRIHGRGAEGFTDFSGAGEWKKPQADNRGIAFNPKDRADIIHGEESNGLGTSTFLEGAPASRAAIQKESENQRAINDGGLGRKKSIAQRIRGISQPRRGYGEGGPRITSPEARYGTAQSPVSPYSGGGSAATAKSTERNPFFNEYDEAYDKKTAAIKIAEAENREGPVKSPTSPGGRNPLARSTTADGLTSPSEPKPSATSGFLNRVKSLKGGRRPRPPPPN